MIDIGDPAGERWRSHAVFAATCADVDVFATRLAGTAAGIRHRRLRLADLGHYRPDDGPGVAGRPTFARLPAARSVQPVGGAAALRRLQALALLRAVVRLFRLASRRLGSSRHPAADAPQHCRAGHRRDLDVAVVPGLDAGVGQLPPAGPGPGRVVAVAGRGAFSGTLGLRPAASAQHLLADRAAAVADVRARSWWRCSPSCKTAKCCCR
jgi:hypothetical protein